ncbi:hypothetical protein [Tissierella praeacuta]|uniref:hypothetical protein n=1 Tax=Tissierella praeacuta TaxID=43131 RepID=UPI00140495DE|nr:hypothetical protein [Tissierella praeacuta]
MTRLSGLVEGILFLSRDAQPQYSQVNVRTLLEESRNRVTVGYGIGLALVQNIITR